MGWIRAAGWPRNEFPDCACRIVNCALKKRVLHLNFEFFPYYKQMKDFLAIHDARFAQGVVWNFVSLVIMALAGLALGLIVAFFYDPHTLGIFNEAYTVYFLASQLGALGIHQSVLRHVAPLAQEPGQREQVFWSGMLMVVVSSTVVTLAVFWGRFWGAWWFGEAEIATALAVLCPGLFFFPLNKVILALENALRHMRTFAIFNALRFVFLLAGLVGLAAWGVPGMYLPAAFSVAEGLLFACLLLVVRRDLAAVRLANVGKNAWQHVSFGVKSCREECLATCQLWRKIDAGGILPCGQHAHGCVAAWFVFAGGLGGCL